MFKNKLFNSILTNRIDNCNVQIEYDLETHDVINFGQYPTIRLFYHRHGA